MLDGAHGGRYGPAYTPEIASAIAICSAAIARLDARISGSFVSKPWIVRAAWSGYAGALQLQGAESEEIDVFSRACDLKIPERHVRATNLDEFGRLGPWLQEIASSDTLAWRDALPTAVITPDQASQHPPLIRALDRIRQIARLDHSLAPWLGLPFALRDEGLSSTPLPCLAGGAKAFRMKRSPSDADWLVVIRSLRSAADDQVDRLDLLERLYRDSQRAIHKEFRPGALPALAALSMFRPLLSPQRVSTLLDLSVAGASKLLERAVAAGLLVEITQRKTWRAFLAADLAVRFGFVKAKLGRPRHEPPPLPLDRDLAEIFDDFDLQMAQIDKMLARM